MGFRNISAWAIRNPMPPIVLFIGLTLMGLVAFAQLGINRQPDVDFPIARVTVIQPGASPIEMETQVTQRVEAALRSVNGVEEINSIVSEGNSLTIVRFTMDTPIDRAVNDVRDRIANIRSDLPDGILEPRIARWDVTDEPLAYFSVSANDMTPEQLSWYVDNTVAKAILGIEGVARVSRRGGVDREIEVILNPQRMEALGITAAQINTQLRQTNVNAAGGRAEIAGSEQAVRVLGNAETAYDLGETQIALPGGRTTRLADVATVRDGFAEQRSLSEMDGRPVVSFAIERARGASEVSIFRETKTVLEKLKAQAPGVRFTLLSTTVEYTVGEYHAAIEAIILGAALAVLVVFLFLRDWRATVISALAIPLSAIPTFWFMQLMGFSLNTLTLLALSLVAGVLVDDAIVEIENIVRHMRMGKTAYQAAIDAADEIGLAVVATTMSIVAVFLPVGMMPGIPGQFFKNFGFTIVAAVLFSLAVARLITPLIAAYFLKEAGHAEHANGPLMQRYMRVLAWSLGHRWAMVGAGAAAFALTILCFWANPFEFSPARNTDYSQVSIEMTPGTTLAQTEAVAQKARLMLATAPEVMNIYADIQVGKAQLMLTLKPNRKQSTVAFERTWAPKLASIEDARIHFVAQSFAGGNGSGRDISIILGSSDPALLERTANTLIDQMSRIEGVVAPRVAGDQPRPEITIEPKQALAAEMGVTAAALSQTIRIATIGEIDQAAAKFSLADRQVPIRVILPPEARRTLGTIANLPVPTQKGGSVPLHVVATVKFGSGPTTIRRNNQERSIVVGADLAPGLVTGNVMPKINKLPILAQLPIGVSRLTIGQARAEKDLMSGFVFAVVTGILLVFAVLVLLYRRVMPPFVNLGSLMLAPLGGGLAILLTRNPTSMPVMIGLLMLLGIVAKNSILLLDFALEEMERGVDPIPAILEAGHKRAQPIIMTTVAMVAGMLPIALSLSGDGSWNAPMAITVIGGLTVSTALTLLIVPATFSLAIDFENRITPYVRRWVINDGARPAPAAPTVAPQAVLAPHQEHG